MIPLFNPRAPSSSKLEAVFLHITHCAELFAGMIQQPIPIKNNTGKTRFMAQSYIGFIYTILEKFIPSFVGQRSIA